MKTLVCLMILTLSVVQVLSQDKPVQTKSKQAESLFEIQKNSFLVETNLIATLKLQYERLLPVKNHFGFILGGGYIMGIGFGHGSQWFNVESLVVLGGPKHIFETGLAAFLGSDNGGPGLKAGYRFQHKTGLLLKADLYYVTFEDPPVLPMFGVGYSF